MKALLKLMTLVALITVSSGCTGKYIHEDATERQKDAGYQNFVLETGAPLTSQFHQVSCTQLLGDFGTSIRKALNTHGEPQEKASTQLRCYEHPLTNEPILQIRSRLSGEWIWLTRK